MYRALTVARYIIERYNNKKKIISNLKLQKILYFVQAEFLVSTGHVCFIDKIEAWDFGPVVPVVYHNYKVYGAGNIPVVKHTFGHMPITITESDQAIINDISDQCAKYSAAALVDLTHRQTPWMKAYRPGCNNIITPQSIKSYFEEK